MSDRKIGKYRLIRMSGPKAEHKCLVFEGEPNTNSPDLFVFLGSAKQVLRANTALKAYGIELDSLGKKLSPPISVEYAMSVNPVSGEVRPDLQIPGAEQADAGKTFAAELKAAEAALAE